MADYMDVMRAFKRMCHFENCATATGCPMNCSNLSQCRKFAFERPAEFENRVMKWAEEHPETYPSWREWLMQEKVISMYSTHKSILALEAINHPIPEDIAQKLGLTKVTVKRDEKSND